jgi:hypothetical protein
MWIVEAFQELSALARRWEERAARPWATRKEPIFVDGRAVGA